MAHNIEADFIMDYSKDEPRRLVRLTLDADTVRKFQHSFHEGGDFGMSTMRADVAMQAYAYSTLMGNILTELESRSLFKYEEFKATGPQPGVNL